jgi:hypothetical protein
MKVRFLWIPADLLCTAVCLCADFCAEHEDLFVASEFLMDEGKAERFLKIP